MNRNSIRATGVRVHNLKNIDVEVRHGRLTVVCGVSGSGKSSLAFDTLYAEGQRRYVETFSPSVRQFMDRVERPDADRIDGMPPAIAIRQNAHVSGSFSTVGTRTEIYDSLRNLFSAAGTLTCDRCDVAASVVTSDSATQELIRHYDQCRGLVTFEFRSEGDEVSHGEVAGLIDEGYARCIVDQKIQPLNELLQQSLTVPASIQIVSDRIRISEDSLGRIRESFESVFERTGGRAVLLIETSEQDQDCRSTADSGQFLPHEFTQVDGKIWRVREMHRGFQCFSCDQPFGEPIVSSDARLQPSGATLQLLGRSILNASSMPVSDLQLWLHEVQNDLDDRHRTAVHIIFEQLQSRLNYLVASGLDYLSLDRRLATLSGGEAQRVILTAALGSGLINTLYVLDEPSSGLHPQDSSKVLSAIRNLQQQGNSVVVVEHNSDFILAADDVIEIGPSAGKEGGEVVFYGSPDELLKADTATGKLLSTNFVERKESRDVRQPENWLSFEGIQCHNIQHLDVKLPLGVICVFTGVSGSGKSSLVAESIYPALCQKVGKVCEYETAGQIRNASGLQHLSDVRLLNQNPLRASRRSIPATIMNCFDEIRNVLAATHEAKKRNFRPGMFSFNSSAGGRCEHCDGIGRVTIEMQFLADIETTCESCWGKRFRPEVLEVRYRDRTIDDILNMTVEEAFTFFHKQKKIQQKLNSMRQAGLGYLRLGQPVSTLSGGEAQRVRIAGMLAGIPIDSEKPSGQKTASTASESTLFILDEPSTGLHMQDIGLLMKCLNHLVDIGHTVWVIEHDASVICHSDYLVQLGPRAGSEGGRIIRSGPPLEFSNVFANDV